MTGAGIIEHYFPNLNSLQKSRFDALLPLYKEWNEKINVISRKDIESLYVHHVLHSLSILKVISFMPGTKILDAGTGGGFPGIPLAIMQEECEFHLVDSIGKKITVVNEISKALNLENVKAEKARMETLSPGYDFVVSRAVSRLKEIYSWTSGLIRKKGFNEKSNGIICLKGGDLSEEISELGRKKVEVTELKQFFSEDFLDTKKIVYVPLTDKS
ncbi:MAG: 16S rRNA (guanine(527)-N(7))-methyltransferase RsmG [Bacteroidetes bacterium]|nr:MAG: 16S rRNA (guanine(527)-N(7))-methyltransferase RsmG [Bacteroidota bacterium]REK07577.1 MAG: 16S rRNA (guanine(527)-N(7))-methyltransferase RsmG [Bacteroidota bacterium]REK36990.1 MAG: 16S rRNA (guanine(527)-N(7))-methyltransferase RsmG [Bacteroidota bacterium]REK47811.1 MAG: 16S rRNA (guanine(527)-N(7))-methyltransferase RsmG [Bacteroidota bacterium]